MTFPQGFSLGLNMVPGGGLPPGGGGGGGPGPFPVNAVNFDGTNDYLDKVGDLTGNADGINFLVSCWFKVDAGTDGIFERFIYSNGNRVHLQRDNANKLSVRLINTVGAQVWGWTSTLLFSTVANLGWNHILVSAQLAATPITHKYINDTIEAGTDNVGPLAGTIDWTNTTWNIGADNGGLNRFHGDMAEVYMTNEFLDISVEANRRKFIDVNGFPVDLGAAGITPTGTAALIFQSGATATWHTNKGSGGGFTEIGALTDAASSPSD